MTAKFDPAAKERALHDEAASWDTSAPLPATPDDVPTVDVGRYFDTGNRVDLDRAAAVLREASEKVGFHQLVGHGIEPSLINEIFATTARFHSLDVEVKRQILMDRPDWPVRGSGYLPLGERKLPRRTKGNVNEAFLVKSDRLIGFDDNQWLPDSVLPEFRQTVETYAGAVSDLARRLLPVYAVALDLEPNFFTAAFDHPFWRLRLTHYPPDQPREDDQFGIAPHVDTTFFTLLLQNAPGLTIFSAERQAWISVPSVPNAFVVNSGELLRQWSNDRFLSTRHFADNESNNARYSIPFFFNATADYPMECLPSCHGPGNPPRYPTISYAESQAVVQGE